MVHLIDFILGCFSNRAEKEDWINLFNSLERKSTQPLPETIDLSELQSTFLLSNETTIGNNYFKSI